MYSLLIDTHFKNIILVLYKDKTVLDKMNIESREHSVHTISEIDNILRRNEIKVNDLKQIFVVNGPGSFTGVRIGVTIAKTLAFTLKIPIKSIDSITIQAICIEDEEKLVKVNDQNGVFYGMFSSNKLVGNFEYLKFNEFDNFIKDKELNIYENVDIDYKKVIDYFDNIKTTNPHKVNPLYIKNIEV